MYCLWESGIFPSPVDFSGARRVSSQLLHDISNDSDAKVRISDADARGAIGLSQTGEHTTIQCRSEKWVTL
jgi:hypothetical protein